jgi:hypothetical protein
MEGTTPPCCSTISFNKTIWSSRKSIRDNSSSSKDLDSCTIRKRLMTSIAICRWSSSDERGVFLTVLFYQCKRP